MKLLIEARGKVMKTALYQFLIPTLNNVNDIDITIESIYNQNFDKDRLFVMVLDFGSTDGTYEKLINYKYNSLGIYRSYKTCNKRQMNSEMLSIIEKFRSEYVDPFYYTFMYPGDEVYPDYLNTCDRVIHEHENVSNIICEADIFDRSHKKIGQRRLYDKMRIINGNKQAIEYINKGFDHQIQCMSRKIPYGNNQVFFEMNEQRWWNKCLKTNMNTTAIYIEKALCCQKAVEYEDELEEILFRWGSIIKQQRHDRAEVMALSNECYEEAFKQIARYALWRGALYKYEKPRMAEDCVLLSEVIYPGIKNSSV